MQTFQVFVICVEATIYLFLYNLLDCTFNRFVNESINSVQQEVIKVHQTVLQGL